MTPRVLFLAAVGMLATVQAAKANPCASFPLDITSVAKEAHDGNAYCQAVLALEYMRGTSGTQSDIKADALAAAIMDSTDAMAVYVVATLHEDGSPSQGISEDEERSVELRTQFVAKLDIENSTDPNHMLALGFVRRYGTDDQAADDKLGCSYILRAAELGHPHAMFHLAGCIADGHIERATEPERLAWLVKATELRHPQAAWSLGESNFEVGFFDAADKYYQIAAAFGDPDYALRLGRIYEVGLLNEPNWQRAEEYYRQASKAGNDTASYRLGWIYLTGHGDFEENFELAIAAFQTAKDQGNIEAARILEVLAE